MENPEQVIPIIEEELVAGTEAVKTGSVRVTKKVDHVRKRVEMPAIRDVVEVSRVQVNRLVDALPQIREEGDLLIISVVEEQIVVQKRLVVTEEIRIRRRRTSQKASKVVTLDRERAVVERLDSEGRVIARSEGKSATAESSMGPHKSLLD